MGSKRENNAGKMDGPSTPKRPKPNIEIKNRALEGVLNETLNDLTDNSFISSPLNDSRRKVSLSRSILARKSLISHNVQDDSDDDHMIEKAPPVLTPIEYKNNLKSLHEIISKSFDPKRAFNYNFINIINSFINNEKGTVDFKLIALSLDAGTKVYTSKVDVVYRNIQKVSSSLSMATEEKELFDGDDEAIFGDDFDRYEKKKRKKSKKNFNPILTNLDTINGRFETNNEVDPLFHHLSAAIDVGNVNSLLMANLNTDPRGTMLLDSNASLDFSSTETIEITPMNYYMFKDLKDPFVENQFISSRFKSFEFLRRDIELEFTKPAIATTQSERINYDFDINAEVEEINEPANDFDFDFDNGFNTSANENENQQSTENQSNTKIFAADKLLEILPESDNHLFNKNFLRQVLRKSRFVMAARILQTDKTAKQKRLRKVHEENEYFCVTEPYEFKNKSKCASNTLQRWIAKSNNFQIKNDFGFTGSELHAFFFKETTFNKLIQAQAESMKTPDNNKDVLSDNDDEGFRHDDDFPSSMPHDDEPLDLNLNTEDKIEDDHIDALDIDYAKVAKKIDIKRVKKGMWDVIVKEGTNLSSLSMNSEVDTQTKALSFADLRHTLPNHLNSNLNQNLSIPISFVALLHLCNEKTLALAAETFDDFQIHSQLNN